MRRYCPDCEETVIPDFGICPNCGRNLEAKKKKRSELDDWQEDDTSEWGGDDNDYYD